MYGHAPAEENERPLAAFAWPAEFRGWSEWDARVG
ncbi:hypothetical protein FHR81_000584 [Actinoalloteichus hoggarensis]|nr:hypothetical protein [Actinoalloteichus hoggarensis]